MPRKQNGTLVLAAGVAALLLLSQKSQSKAAKPLGVISDVNVSQRLSARLGAHLQPKAVGEDFLVIVTWTPNTKNALGAGIPWDYQMEYEIRTDAGDLVRSGVFLTLNNFLGPGVPHDSGAILAGLAAPGKYGVRITLTAKSSDAVGNPVLPYVQLASLPHDLALAISAADPTADLNWVRIGTVWTSPPDGLGRRETFLLTSYVWHGGASFGFICTITSRDGIPTPGLELATESIRNISNPANGYTVVIGTGETFLAFKQRVGAI